jgi:hypothetical protein
LVCRRRSRSRQMPAPLGAERQKRRVSGESPRLRAWWQSPVSRSSTVSALNLRLVAQNDIQQ